MSQFESKKKIFLDLKKKSGSHSPSISTLFKNIPDLFIDVDACFLSNPYASDLFFDYFNDQLIKSKSIRDIIEYYPAQNNSIASILSKSIKIDSENIFISNGAIEGIQAVLHRFVNDSIVLPIPTFSSYYEYLEGRNIKLYKYNLKKELDYKLNLDDYSKFINENSIKNCIIINPNNPDGNYIDYDSLVSFVKKNSHLQNIIIDESFVHFTYDNKFSMQSLESLTQLYPNVIIIKSLSKDFGIAGIRAGYLVMRKEYVKELLSNGYLWNSNGLAEYFFKLYSDKDFNFKYSKVRIKYIKQTIKFYKELSKIKELHVIKSKANFFLVEIKNKMTSQELFINLLFKYNIYVRDCSDKVGLKGQYVRIASRSYYENKKIIKALKNLFK